MYQHSTEILGGKRGGLHQGEERDLDCASVQWMKPELWGENFWVRGYFFSTVGLDEEMVRAYIRHQEKKDEHYDQLKLGM